MHINTTRPSLNLNSHHLQRRGAVSLEPLRSPISLYQIKPQKERAAARSCSNIQTKGKCS